MRYVLDSVWNAEAGIQSLGIMEIQNLTYPSSVPASTQFIITYNARNTTTTSQLAFGYIQNLTTGSQIDGSYWEQTVAANTSYPVSTSFPSGIITTLNGEVRLGHVAADTYTLGVSINPVGSGTVSLNPSGPYTPNTVVQMTANAISGYQFLSWSGDATGSTNPVNITMNSNKSVTANFQALSYYTLITSSNPSAGGYVTLNPSGGTYLPGVSVQITAVTNSGYQFTGWSGDASGTTNPTLIVMNSNKSVTANFQASSNYFLTTSVSPVGAGTVSLSPSGGSYPSGTVVQLTAYANTNYSFTGWSGSTTGTANPVSITMNGDKMVTANFISTAVCSSFMNPTNCINNGCYWWISDGKCHDIPEPSPCSTHTSPYDCVQNDCFWWTSDNTCHDTPEVICPMHNSQPDECVSAGCYYNWSTNQCTSTPSGGFELNPMYIAAVVGAVIVAGLVIVGTSKGGKTKR